MSWTFVDMSEVRRANQRTVHHAPPIPDTCGLFVQMIVVAVCSIFLIIFIGLRGDPNSKADARRATLSSNHGINEDEDTRSKRERDNVQDLSETEPYLPYSRR